MSAIKPLYWNMSSGRSLDLRALNVQLQCPLFVNFWETENFHFSLFCEFLFLDYFRASNCWFFFPFFSSLSFAGHEKSTKLSFTQTHTHTKLIGIIDMQVGYGANGHRTNMRLPFSLTKYMRFSVFIFIGVWLLLFFFLSFFKYLFSFGRCSRCPSLLLLNKLMQMYFYTFCTCAPFDYVLFRALFFSLSTHGIMDILFTPSQHRPFFISLFSTCDHFSLDSFTLSRSVHLHYRIQCTYAWWQWWCVHRFSKHKIASFCIGHASSGKYTAKKA